MLKLLMCYFVVFLAVDYPLILSFQNALGFSKYVKFHLTFYSYLFFD